MNITREIGKEAQRSALGYLAMAFVFTFPMGLALSMLAGWPLLVVTMIAHFFPTFFVFVTADLFYTAIARSPLWGMIFGLATLLIGGFGFCIGLILLGQFTSFAPFFSFLPNLKVSLGIASIFILPALLLGAMLSLRFQDIHNTSVHKNGS